MVRTKQTAKKSNGGSAPRVSLQVDEGSTLAGENAASDGRNAASDGQISRGDEMEICSTDVHNGVSVIFCAALRWTNFSPFATVLYHMSRWRCTLRRQYPLYV